MGAAKPVFGSGLVFGEKLEEKAVVPDKPVTQVGGEGCRRGVTQIPHWHG